MFSFAANLGHIQMSPKVPNRPIYCLPLHMAVGLPSTPLPRPATIVLGGPPPGYPIILNGPPIVLASPHCSRCSLCSCPSLSTVRFLSMAVARGQSGVRFGRAGPSSQQSVAGDSWSTDHGERSSFGNGQVLYRRSTPSNPQSAASGSFVVDLLQASPVSSHSRGRPGLLAWTLPANCLPPTHIRSESIIH